MCFMLVFCSDEQERDSLCLHMFIVMTQIAILHMLDLHLKIWTGSAAVEQDMGCFSILYNDLHAVELYKEQHK